MGFFSSKACPICGGTTPKLLAKKVDGQAICSACADNIMADDDLVKKWSVDDLRIHLKAREENLQLLQSLTPSRVVNYEHEAVVDDAKRLFYIKQYTQDNPPVFSFDDILGYNVEVGYHTVESWSKGMVRTPYRPIELGVMGGIAMLADVFTDDDDKDTEYESIVVTLRVNTPYLHEYELCSLSAIGKGSAQYTNDLAREMAKVNTICELIVSLTEPPSVW